MASADRHVIEQTRTRIRDVTTATFEPTAAGTRVTVVAFAHVNLAVRAAMLLDRGHTAREFQAELDRFATLAGRTARRPRIGGVYLVPAGAWRRWVTVIGATDDRIHVRLHPGHLRDQDPDDAEGEAPRATG
jgi:hypothetical protein